MRTVHPNDGTIHHPKSRFLDFVVNDVSLLATTRQQGNLVTPFNGAWHPSAWTSAVESLLGGGSDPELPAGRVPLLVCGECGDLACGAITTALAVSRTEVTWSNFNWETGLRDPEDAPRRGIRLGLHHLVD